MGNKRDLLGETFCSNYSGKHDGGLDWMGAVKPTGFAEGWMLRT